MAQGPTVPAMAAGRAARLPAMAGAISANPRPAGAGGGGGGAMATTVAAGRAEGTGGGGRLTAVTTVSSRSKVARFGVAWAGATGAGWRPRG